jgi:hypothetical protein
MQNQYNYEVQIKELIEKCNQLETDKFAYQEELSQTKDASQNIYNELSLLKERYEETDPNGTQKYKLQRERNE